MIKKKTKKKTDYIPNDLNDPRFRQFIINVLRRASYRQWKPRSDALKNARISRGRYECVSCGRKDVTCSEKQLDHTIPVIDERGQMGMPIEEIIERMFPQVEGWGVLCEDCHKAKTFLENEGRKDVRKAQKEKDSIQKESKTRKSKK